jgi:SWI/SNF-related matrix-associated actin-dependent regulator 1 of chromatin subfamily A
VFIVNFEIIREILLLLDFKPATKDLQHSTQIIMDPRIGLFKSAIIDEIHKPKNPKSLEQRSY